MTIVFITIGIFSAVLGFCWLMVQLIVKADTQLERRHREIEKIFGHARTELGEQMLRFYDSERTGYRRPSVSSIGKGYFLPGGIKIYRVMDPDGVVCCVTADAAEVEAWLDDDNRVDVRTLDAKHFNLYSSSGWRSARADGTAW